MYLKELENQLKENILALETEIFALKSVILKQNDIIKQLSEKLLELSKELEETKNRLNQPISTGNEGVNQSINHLINQSLINQSLNHIDLSTQPEEPISVAEPKITEEKIPLSASLITSQDQVPKQDSLSTSLNERTPIFNIDLGTIIQKKQENLLENEIFSFKTNINKAFSSLSKQELRLFLTLYQLDDEMKEGVSYIDLSSKLELTEPCIRGYVSTLMKKGLPILRKKLNNRRTILTISRNFKSLGLKQKLVSLYYESDPRQTTLFDRI